MQPPEDTRRSKDFDTARKSARAARGSAPRRAGSLKLLEAVSRTSAVRSPLMSVLRRRAFSWFALVVVLSVLGLFFLDGASAGLVLFAAMLIFILACIRALAGQDRPPDDRAGLGGWFSRGL
jgi:Flp pilus assembly protein TadB